MINAKEVSKNSRYENLHWSDQPGKIQDNLWNWPGHLRRAITLVSHLRRAISCSPRLIDWQGIAYQNMNFYLSGLPESIDDGNLHPVT